MFSRFQRLFSLTVLVVILLLPLASAPVLLSAQGSTPSQQNTAQEASGRAEADVSTIPAPEVVKLKFLPEPPKFSPEEIERLEWGLERINLPGPNLPTAAEPVAGPSKGSGTKPPWSEIDAVDIETKEDSAGGLSLPLAPQAPGTFRRFRRFRLPNAAAPNRSTRMEASLANSGRYVFYTGNWFAARSTNRGQTWSYVNPFADMQEFCCDQDVIYDEGRDIFLWYRQGDPDASGNRFRLGVSRNATNWWFYDLRPIGLNNAWTNQWYDYPHLALSNDFLYIATNMFDFGSDGVGGTNDDNWTRTVILRWPLSRLLAGTGFNYRYYAQSARFNFTPVQGVGLQTMYWGTHNSTNSFRIYRWAEDSTTIYWNNRTIPAWSPTPRGRAHCRGPGGYNWCAWADSRVVAGWVAKGVIGFFWNVREGSGFPWPYVNAATFRESDRAYLGRPFIWWDTNAWLYASASPNKRGHLGIAAWWGNRTVGPTCAVGIDDDFNGDPPGWEMGANVAQSNRTPSNNAWGDYLRVRQFEPSEKTWIVGCHIIRNGVTGASVQPWFAFFGRERDLNSVMRWWFR